MRVSRPPVSSLGSMAEQRGGCEQDGLSLRRHPVGRRGGRVP